MAINYPTSLDSLTNPLSTDLLTSPAHSTQHSNVNDAVEALEAKVGADASAVTTSHDYKLGEVTGTDKAVGKTATQTLTNKTLTAPQINMGSDATGDTYYRTAGGAFARLPIGTSGQILQSNASSIPEWIANPSAADSSTTVKGVVELATTAEITAGTSTGGTGAALVIPASAVGSAGASKLVQYDASGKLPAVDGSQLTNIANPATYASGTFNKDISTTTTNTIAHGLGKTPKYARLTAKLIAGTTTPEIVESVGGSDGSTHSCVYIAHCLNGSTRLVGNAAKFAHLSYNASTVDTTYIDATATLDSTNLTITWSATGSNSSKTAYFVWEVFA